MIRRVIDRVSRTASRAPGRIAMRLGRISKATPLSKNWGFDRGEPVDRFYIANFLAAHADDIRGRVLEVAEDLYSSRFGGERVTRLDIVSLHPTPIATITGDLTQPATLPAGQFDCIICTQTLQLLFDLRAAVENLRRALRPGGVLLLTAPAITPIDRGEWKESWYWSFTEASLRRLHSQAFDPEKIEVSVYGNLNAATGFLHGAAVEDIGAGKLRMLDPAYPVIVAARAVA